MVLERLEMSCLQGKEDYDNRERFRMGWHLCMTENKKEQRVRSILKKMGVWKAKKRSVCLRYYDRNIKSAIPR